MGGTSDSVVLTLSRSPQVQKAFIWKVTSLPTGLAGKQLISGLAQKGRSLSRLPR